MHTEHVIIIGSGCAGSTAAVYTARADLKPVIFEGMEPGGQLTTTSVIENYPGFVEGIDGFELMSRMKAQAERFGARFEYGEVKSLRAVDGHFEVEVQGRELLRAETVILASGARARMLGLPRERELTGHGLSTCATCDGAFFRGVPVTVVGGGDSAMEEALFLTRFASEVHLVHRRDSLRASKIMADRLLAHPKVTVHWNSQVVAIAAEGDAVSAVTLEDTKTGARRQHETRGLFYAIGHIPNTDFIQPGLVPLDGEGYVDTADVVTPTPGLFVAGDVHDRQYQQAVTAAGEGCKAALEAEAYLSARGS